MATSTMQGSSESMKRSTSKKAAKREVQTRTSLKSKGKDKPAGGFTTQLYRHGRDAVASAYDSAAKAGARASNAIPNVRGNFQLRSRSQSLFTMMEERPLVMGAVGLGVGMVMAALLPSMSSHHHQD
jgi:hypothetical protein